MATNTIDSGQLTSTQKLTELIESIFSSNQIIHAFGYGSGVFSQGHNPGMLDMILVVQDAQVFHWENQAKNPSHYATWIRSVDPQGYVAAGLQRCFLGGRDGKVFFHVIEDPIPLKYGVIQYEDFIQDLTQWKSLYIAGRLHKPTLSIPLAATTTTTSKSTKNKFASGCCRCHALVTIGFFDDILVGILQSDRIPQLYG